MKRPAGIYVIAIFMLISSAIGLFIGLRGLGVDLPSIGALILNPGTPMFLPVGILSSTMFVLSIIGFVLAIGLLAMKGWARTGALTIAIILLLGDLFFFMTGGFGLGIIGVYTGVGGAIVNLIVIIYLKRGSVKEAFKS